ncbi:MAG: hypothetical protein KQI78_06850 [Deltaproteobacteria bacterium]|nr:hypothetical protein [Deltaproteobacteria bacterium]
MKNYAHTKESVQKITLNLLAYCQNEGWAGWDPYDALNSRLFRLLPFLDQRIPRLILIQSMKRSPINLRRMMLVPKTQNPKALALFLSSLIKIRKMGLAQNITIKSLIEQIKELRSPDTPYWCWGYSFPWQTRTLLVPRGAPNLVCTTFVANALLDAYQDSADPACFEMAQSAAAYILNELYWTQGNSVACFCYPTPSARSRVHNANFLGAALLCRIYQHNKDDALLDAALRVCRYSVSKQEDDGSWYYGEHSSQQWIDNFHTGYNLCALADIGQFSETREFEVCLRRGFDFYQRNFFTPEGEPQYFHNRIYPIDIHSAAQSIITLLRFESMEETAKSKAYAVLRWVCRHMLDHHDFFYYQKTPYYMNKIPYIRWSQAWILYALSIFLEQSHEPSS